MVAANPPDVAAENLEAVRGMQRAIFDHLRARGEDRASYMAWFRAEFVAGTPGGKPDPDDAKSAYWFARALWNVLPLESNGFRPLPFPPPQRGRACPCGSGEPFESCCEQTAPKAELPDHVMWAALAESRPEEFWIEASRQHRLPPIGVYFVAEHCLNEARWQAVIDLLEPCLSPGRRIDPELALTIQTLCDAYDAVDETPRKEKLLRRLGGDPDADIRCSANRLLASWLHDQGRRDEAWDLIATVERDIPNDASTVLIELTMLAAERRFEDAAALAAERLESVARNPNVSAEDMALILGFRDDPKRGRDDFHRLSLPDSVNALLDFIDAHRQRPRPTLRWRRLKGTDDDEFLRGAHEPLVDKKARALERRWRRLSGMTSPFSTDPVSGSEAEAWLDADEWLPWLEANPRALDVLGILDDIVRLLIWIEPDETSDDRWTMWLLARATSMIGRSWPARNAGRAPWVHGANRPGLRLLWQYALRLRESSGDRAERFERLYLRLNPHDNHGIRHALVNHLLIAGRDADALDLAERYPDDVHPETTYGRVLALFRLGHLDAAADALTSARRRLPMVPDYLLRDVVETPTLDESRVRVGGEDQAWLYREDMRDAWMKTDGMRRWLAQRTAHDGS